MDFHQKPGGASGNGKLKCKCPSDGDLLCHFSVSPRTLFPSCRCHRFSTKHTQQKSRLQPCRGPSSQLGAPREKETWSRHGTSPRPRVESSRSSFAFPVLSPRAPSCPLLAVVLCSPGTGSRALGLSLRKQMSSVTPTYFLPRSLHSFQSDDLLPFPPSPPLRNDVGAL